MLDIGVRAMSGELLVGGEHRAQGVESILSGLLPRAALTEGTGHLEDTGDDPSILVRILKEKRELELGHEENDSDGRAI